MVLHNSRNKLGLHYEPDNLDINKVTDIPSTHEESRFESVEYVNL